MIHPIEVKMLIEFLEESLKQQEADEAEQSMEDSHDAK
jgi:hypothetical protein